ncbi:KR domain-containing protein, partial [Mycobacterium sp. M1]
EVASHTAYMDPILDELAAALAGITPQSPAIPFISTVFETTPVLDAQYWVANVRRPARVAQAVTAAANDYDTFIEISPHPILTHTIGENLADVPHHAVGTLLRDTDDTVGFHQSLSSTHPDPDASRKGPGPLLPRTPWRHTTHWLDMAGSAATTESAPRPGTLLGTHLTVSGNPPVHLWQARVSADSKPYPGAHRNNGVELVPASVLLQTLSEAAATVSATAVASDIRFELPIALDRPLVIQVVADHDSIAVSSRPATDDARWMRHLTARITRTTEENPTRTVEFGDVDEALSDESVTALWQTWGSEGRPFDWSISTGQHTAAALRADIEVAGPAGTVALLDAALHLARMVDSDNPDLMVPVTVDSVRLASGPADGQARIGITRRDGGDGDLVVDITATAPDGTGCLDVRGVRYTALGAAPAGDPASIAHAIDWQPWDGAPDAPNAPGTVAVLGDGAAADGLRGALTAAGHTSADVDTAAAVLYVAGDGLPGETDLDYATRVTADVAGLVSRLVQRDHNPPALWLVTRGVHEAASASAVRQSCLWGLAGVIRAEQPQLCGGLVDLPEQGPEQVQALSGVLRTPAKSVLVLRDGQFLAPAFTPITGPAQREPTVCRPDAAYLITGGLGALGLLMAGWLADRGARRLVLAGRGGLPPRRDWDGVEGDAGQKITAIRALERRGVTVDVVALDSGSREAVQALLDRRDADCAPEIRGVIHAAGLTEGQLLTEIDSERLRDTLWPKIAGAQVLHEAFPVGSVDFFFMTAAAGAVFGVPGQGAYATGNAYLDGLARARHRQGCHSVSLDWVAWKGLGFGATAHVVLHELERLGSRPITPAEAFAAWDHVEHYDVAQAVMVPLPSADGPATPATAAPTRDWSELPAEVVLSELETGLRSILARELRMPEAELPLDRPFAELGLNSVMVMSVRRDTEQLVGLELSATMLYNHPTVTALAAHLAARLLPPDGADDTGGGLDGGLDDSADSVLNDLFDSVESASAGWDGI